ncbi:hypothetical protein [Streptomyces sp. 900116325]
MKITIYGWKTGRLFLRYGHEVPRTMMDIAMCTGHSDDEICGPGAHTRKKRPIAAPYRSRVHRSNCTFVHLLVEQRCRDFA